MIPGDVGIVTISTILLFLIPILIVAKNQGLQKPLTFQKILRIFNKALLIQFVLGLTLFLTAFSLDKIDYVDNNVEMVAYNVVGMAYTFNVIGLFMYLPVIALLNLISLIIKVIFGKSRI
ncbi:hypothetical protein I5M27_09135 [Adhaeribacter sp. BT258]|uniref:Uncharacterized protein n=1 Tax=Adhaeribacter terrigena TaxID=2793070 RepID=A0ABS1C1S9_9BACT|nr:hypothetical protein [Adhaeribacter terrigena]MBK0403147.1 hypothetical protein [Adhaeribacter terrigena]